MENMFHIQVKDELFGENWIECFATATVIMGATYEQVDVHGVIDNLSHLNACQNADLLQMFNGTLGIYPHKKRCIDTDPDAKPIYG